MAVTVRMLSTRRGAIPFPAYIPVTTFGETYPLDRLIRPYLSRLAPAVMVSYYYAQTIEIDDMPSIPLCIDSGGFSALFENSRILQEGELGVIEIARDSEVERLDPATVLTLQERIADVGFTLDFPIPLGISLEESKWRQDLTIANAFWAIKHRRRQDLKLYACVQAWDVASARTCAQAYVNTGFDGIAIGGLVPRVHQTELILAIVSAVRAEIRDLPLHIFGLGHPNLVSKLFACGADSVDSSSYVRLAADGKLWSDPTFICQDPSPMDRLHLALCNLASATSRTLPLSTAQPIFSTLRANRKE